MAEVVNLRRVRKDKMRRAASDRAAESRAAHGRSKIDKMHGAAVRDLEARRLDDHRIEQGHESAVDGTDDTPR